MDKRLGAKRIIFGVKLFIYSALSTPYQDPRNQPTNESLWTMLPAMIPFDFCRLFISKQLRFVLAYSLGYLTFTPAFFRGFQAGRQRYESPGTPAKNMVRGNRWTCKLSSWNLNWRNISEF